MDDRNAVKYSDSFSDADVLSGVRGDSLYVINLCAANLPQSIDADSVRSWGIPGLESYRLYQVSRMEDGRRRYRLRLGFFSTEADAENVLKTVRGKFATAFTSGLCDEDIKHASTYLKRPIDEIREIQDVQRTGRYRMPKFSAEDLARVNGANGDSASSGRHPAVTASPAAPTRPSIARAASAVLDQAPARAQGSHQPHDEVVEVEWTPPNFSAAAPAKTQPAARPAASARAVQKSTAKSAPVAPAKASAPASAKAQVAPVKAPDIQLTASTPPPVVARPKHAGNQPFHVAAGRAIPDSGPTLTPEQPATKSPAKVGAAKPADLPRPLVSAEALAKLRAGAVQPRQPSSEIPTLDTTQTIRTLTKTEMEDANAPKWFVVQLAISDQPANLDTMPRLDIFEAYRLYSVAVMQNNVIRHALRLGFFSEHVSAEAVMGYVKTFFGEPTIERVSDAEQKRFVDPPAKPSADHAKAQARVITLEEKRPKPEDLAAMASVSVGDKLAKAAAQRTANKSAAPAVKRSAPIAPKKSGAQRGQPKKTNVTLDEARLLGLSDTAIRRVERNPSLLSRLVDRLTK